MLVDSHCHLNLMDPGRYGCDDVAGVIDNARAAGVDYMLCVSIDRRHLDEMLEMIEPFDRVYGSAGVHPNGHGEEEPSVEELVALAQRPKVVAIGETGLDYYRSAGDLEWQRERFRAHIAAARRAGKPLIIHSREAPDDTLRVLAEAGADAVGGVMHCFVDDWEAARTAMELGFYISFSGIVTFKNAQDLKEVARQVPLDRLLVETDSPYLAPAPYRGKPNQPAYVRHVAEHIAELRDLAVEAVEEATTENFFRLFPHAARVG
ncbi:MAG: YchF/TatD family DNA exonuclease [Gammaproteobacteria bacterium]|nr:TatD family hydrolase [Gammaproteobacteria bacterium]NIV75173.1 YchF/TatD family DNA exonuclease [Gammaproteobacteria bacterium]